MHFNCNILVGPCSRPGARFLFPAPLPICPSLSLNADPDHHPKPSSQPQLHPNHHRHQGRELMGCNQSITHPGPTFHSNPHSCLNPFSKPSLSPLREFLPEFLRPASAILLPAACPPLRHRGYRAGDGGPGHAGDYWSFKSTGGGRGVRTLCGNTKVVTRPTPAYLFPENKIGSQKHPTISCGTLGTRGSA